jgi:microfibrillar-associated protein 1
MTRLKRDAELREHAELEKAELIRRRNMTEEERLEEDRKMGRFDPKEKTQQKFLQKYYHKGVFYMDVDSLDKDDVRKKDYHAPTQSEKTYNYESLQKVQQVKNFGKRSRTKYTHLADQDTTIKDKADKLRRPDDRILDTYMKKRAGVGEIDSAGRLKRSKKD